MFRAMRKVEKHCPIPTKDVTSSTRIPLLFILGFLNCVYSLETRLTIYSARRFIGSRIIESAAYCNHILLVLLNLNSNKNIGLFKHLVIAITFMLVRSDPNKRRGLQSCLKHNFIAFLCLYLDFPTFPLE